MNRAQVGALIGVAPDTITIYMRESREGGRYAEGGEYRPFPAPDGKFGPSPYWLDSRADEIRAWAIGRPRHGVGGRPRSGS
jgi:hypothetical protein